MKVYKNRKWIVPGDNDFPVHGEANILNMLREAVKQYTENDVDEIALVFITHQGTDKDDWEFDTTYPGYETATQKDTQKVSGGGEYDTVNISEQINIIKYDAALRNHVNFYLAVFHNHGNKTSFCFIDIYTFFSDEQIIAALLDTDKYVYGLRKLTPISARLKSGSSIDKLIMKMIQIVKEQNSEGSEYGKMINAITLNKNSRLADSDLHKMLQTVRNSHFDFIWNQIFSEIGEATFLERFRVTKP